MMAAENTGANLFEVGGNYGSDGDGDVQFMTFEYKNYTSYSHRIYGTKDSSINELIIFETLNG